MQQKMKRFLASIGIKDAERYDLDFVSIRQKPEKGSPLEMIVSKDLPWDFSLLNEFIECLGNINYPYAISFSYLNGPTADDVSGLFFNWYFARYLDTPRIGMEEREAGAFIMHAENIQLFA